MVVSFIEGIVRGSSFKSALFSKMYGSFVTGSEYGFGCSGNPCSLRILFILSCIFSLAVRGLSIIYLVNIWFAFMHMYKCK